jgi:hypothetical protein
VKDPFFQQGLWGRPMGNLLVQRVGTHMPLKLRVKQCQLDLVRGMTTLGERCKAVAHILLMRQQTWCGG